MNEKKASPFYLHLSPQRKKILPLKNLFWEYFGTMQPRVPKAGEIDVVISKLYQTTQKKKAMTKHCFWKKTRPKSQQFHYSGLTKINKMKSEYENLFCSPTWKTEKWTELERPMSKCDIHRKFKTFPKGFNSSFECTRKTITEIKCNKKREKQKQAYSFSCDLNHAHQKVKFIT